MYESQRRAAAAYKERNKGKIKTYRFEVFPTEADITEHLEAKKAAGEKIATYLKRLIREDMQKG